VTEDVDAGGGGTGGESHATQVVIFGLAVGGVVCADGFNTREFPGGDVLLILSSDIVKSSLARNNTYNVKKLKGLGLLFVVI